MHDGKAYTIGPDDKQAGHADLFWAVCGGGGGNFGVVTKFWVRATAVDRPLSTFTVSWDDPTLRAPVMKEWCEWSSRGDVRLTSFCRVSAPDPTNTDLPVVVGGNCVASADDTIALLRKLLPATITVATTIHVEPVHKRDASRLTHADYQPGPPAAALRAVAGVGDNPIAPLANTCSGQSFRHMVSSCFPSPKFGDEAIEKLAAYIGGTTPDPFARRYLSLHAMGGKVADTVDENCFPWREKKFMLQYQAWWVLTPGNGDIDQRSMDWLRKIRDDMFPTYTDGAFINFPDREVSIDRYYGNSLAKLKRCRDKFVPSNIFDFPMSIPRE